MTMHPQAKNKANISGMAVTVTLVFSDEAHRESWLGRMGVIPEEGSFLDDYEHRKRAQNLLYIVAPIGPADFDQEQNATGTTCGYGGHLGRPCGNDQYEVRDHIECQRGHWEDKEPCSVEVRGKPCGAPRYHLRSDHMRTVCDRGHPSRAARPRAGILRSRLPVNSTPETTR
jgi:hypothetical protein